jgi:hypothetical protein
MNLNGDAAYLPEDDPTLFALFPRGLKAGIDGALSALLAKRRVLMHNGAMSALRYRTEEEVEILSCLEKLDDAFIGVRESLRLGKEVTLAPKYSISREA